MQLDQSKSFTKAEAEIGSHVHEVIVFQAPQTQGAITEPKCAVAGYLSSLFANWPGAQKAHGQRFGRHLLALDLDHDRVHVNPREGRAVDIALAFQSALFGFVVSFRQLSCKA